MLSDLTLDVDADLEVDLDVEADLDVETDLEVLEVLPPLLACAKASDWKAVNANPMSATAIVVLIVFMIKKFKVNRCDNFATMRGKILHLSANTRGYPRPCTSCLTVF